MSLAAVESIDDAIDATKRFLLPFDWSLWGRLAVVVWFVGGAGGSLQGLQNLSNVDPSEFPPTPGEEGAAAATATLDPGLPALPGAIGQITPPGSAPVEEFMDLGGVFVVAAALVLVLFGLLLATIGATMEFVLVEALRSTELRVGEYFSASFGNGVRLTLFRFALGLSTLLVSAVAAVALLGPDTSSWSPEALSGVWLPLIGAMIAVGLLTALVRGFTNVFVVPVMLKGDRGVLSAWRRFGATLLGNPGQFLAYLFFSVVLGIGVGIAMGVVLIVALLGIAIVFGLLGVGAYALLSGPALWILGGVIAFLGFTALVLTLLLVRVPFVCFLRYYALFVLGDVDEDLDLVPSLRAEIRP